MDYILNYGIYDGMIFAGMFLAFAIIGLPIEYIVNKINSQNNISKYVK